MTEQKTKKIPVLTISQQEIPHKDLLNGLKKYANKVPYKEKDIFVNSPVLINLQYLEDTKRLCSILNSIMVMVAYNYYRDARIQEVYQLDDDFQEILSMTEGTPFELGMYRPDFIYDTTGQARICEIDCRYPINGWMLSNYLNSTVDNLASNVNENWSSIPEQNEFLKELTSRYDIEEPIFFIQKDKMGIELDYLKTELDKKGVKMICVSPEDLKFEEGQVMAGDQIARQFFLNIDRDELKNFEKDVLRAIIKSGRCINDVRTLILIHDKRVLALLFNEEVMGSYANIDDYMFLKNYLTPSYTIHDAKDREFLINTTENWILKPNSGGNGVDMYIKDKCSKEFWENIVKNEWKNYMVQPYINQQKFTLQGKEDIHLVGYNLFFNGRSFGAGMFRGSSENIVNLNSENGVILPCVLDKNS
ncbi:hypothetical protein AAON49_08375 [Pseudotenacibaculum sp. MALMAid0570]|uniref:hypothetical protein n=1 Tax=Pseudotenacibaculum sp. MALMAid0570 TaxID=3143938 RepID=UPI0032DF07BE